MKEASNKGFSLVELIIVMAIMAVLIGVLAPTYLRYVEKTKRTADCTTIGSVLDACEVLATDPDVKWEAGDSGKLTIVIDTNEPGHPSKYLPTTSNPVKELEKMVSLDNASLSALWGPFTVYAVRDDVGHVKFDVEDAQIAEIMKYSEALANRLE